MQKVDQRGIEPPFGLLASNFDFKNIPESFLVLCKALDLTYQHRASQKSCEYMGKLEFVISGPCVRS